MKKIILLAGLFCQFFAATAQLNVELIAHLPYDSVKANDIWGYVADDGTEYALVGLRTGVSIVSLGDPANPVEVARVEGSLSTWRDLKTFGHYAYVTTDQNTTREGLTVIDLSGLPDHVDYFHWTPEVNGDTLFTCHNIYIDEKGWAYLSGCNVNNGGVVFVDVFSTPGQPQWGGENAPVYAHDAYARDNILYTAEIYEGQFGVYDVSQKDAPVLLAAQSTPFRFCHNVWLSDNGKTLFTTDEKPNAPTAAYDISDLADIRFLDEFRPRKTLGKGVIPHNVHVYDDFLVISHYTDGLVIVDASHPDNLIETGNYDTHFQYSNKFHGAWGAYPFLPSGLCLISDIESGLFVVRPDYVRACRLEGTVRNAETGAVVTGAKLQILSSELQETTSDLAGKYKTGHAQAGTFEVKITHPVYWDKTVEVQLENGIVTPLDIELDPLPVYSVRGQMREKNTGLPIENARVLVQNDQLSFTTTTDADGLFDLPVVTGEYTIYAAAWGFENLGFANQKLEADRDFNFEADRFYHDNFNLDLGWVVSGDAADGQWERGIPRATSSHGIPANPGAGVESDFDKNCFVTGLKSTSIFDKDVDNGTTILTSPTLKLSNYNRPILTYYKWFFTETNPNGEPPNDTLKVFLNNGRTEIPLEMVTEPTGGWSRSTFDLAQMIELTDQMTLRFEVGDDPESGHSVEAGLDGFMVRDSLQNEDFSLRDDLVRFRAFPNPFHGPLTIDYKTEKQFGTLRLLIFNAAGQLVEEVPLSWRHGSVTAGAGLIPGTYFIAFRLDDRLSKALKVVRN